MQHSALINVMVKAALRAGRSLKRDLGEIEHLQVSLKGPANFVSLADKRAEEMLYTDLSKARPGYGFLGEEGGTREGSDKSHTWIVDPLDGTTNFLHGIPHFAVSIALERNGSIVAASPPPWYSVKGTNIQPAVCGLVQVPSKMFCRAWSSCWARGKDQLFSR